MVTRDDKNVAVDFFSGTGSATQAFRDSNNWRVFDVELNPDDDFDSSRLDIEGDIRDVKPSDLPDSVDFVWASPPCTTFSIARCWDYWDRRDDGEMTIPSQKKTVEAVEMVYHTLWLIAELEPSHWVMENPRGYMRKIMPQKPEQSKDEIERETITYCRYGHHLMKPTNLWGELPDGFEARMCSPGSDCHSNEARGMGSGSDHIRDPVERSKVPSQLSEEILAAINGEEVEASGQTTLR